MSKTDELHKLKKLYDQGAVTEEEFNMLKGEIIMTMKPTKNYPEDMIDNNKNKYIKIPTTNFKNISKNLSLVTTYSYIATFIAVLFYSWFLLVPLYLLILLFDIDEYVLGTTGIVSIMIILCFTVYYTFRILNNSEKHRIELRRMIKTFHFITIGFPLFAVTGGLIIFIGFQKVLFALEIWFFNAFDNKNDHRINSQMDAYEALDIFHSTEEISELNTLIVECNVLVKRFKDIKMQKVQRACVLKNIQIKMNLKYDDVLLVQNNMKFQNSSIELSNLIEEFQTW